MDGCRHPGEADAGKRHDRTRRRAGNPASSHSRPHGPLALLRGPLPATRGRHGPAIGVQADRQHKRGAVGAPHGRAEARRIHGEGLWSPDRRDHPPGGSRAVAADAHRRPRRRHIHPRRRADRSRPYDEGPRHGGDSARRGPARERESHGHRQERRRRGRGHDRQGRYQVRDRGQLRRHVGQGYRSDVRCGRASARCRSRLPRYPAHRGRGRRSAHAPRPGRPHLLPAGHRRCGRAPVGRVRDGGGALGHGRHPR